MRKASTPANDAKDEILNTLPTINHAVKPMASSKGKSTAITPAAVATPLPPSSPK